MYHWILLSLQEKTQTHYTTIYSHNSLEQQIGSAAKGEEEVPKVEKHLVSLKQQQEVLLRDTKAQELKWCQETQVQIKIT